MQDKIFYAIGFGFLTGVLWRSFYFVNFYIVVLVAGIATATLLLLIILKNKWGIVISIFILVFTLGILRFGAADILPQQVLESKVGEKIVLSGILSDEPNVRENNQHLVINPYPASPLRKGEGQEGVIYGRILV